MAKVNINDVLQGLIQPIGSLKGGSTYPVTAADQIWVYTDHDTHRPLDEYLGAMKTEAAETTQTFVSNATALTEGKIAKTSIVGGRAAKCKVGDIVLVADGNIYKISAIDETNITLVLPALASYATAASLPRNRVLHGALKDATGAPSYPSGGGGSGVAPRLNLMESIDSENPTVRTSITEAEKINIEKGLYNSVLYVDTSLGEDSLLSIYFPENATYIDGTLFFSIYNASLTGDTSATINNLHVYILNIGEKNADGTYPIAIENRVQASFGGGGLFSSSTLNLVNMEDATIRTSITEEEKTNIEKGTYTSVFYYDPTIGDEWAVLTAFYPKQAMSFGDSFHFSAYQFSSDRSSITGAVVYSLNIEKNNKNEDGTYPITINRFTTAPFAAIKITFKD